MWQAIATFLTRVVGALSLILLGQEREKRKQAEADAELLKKQADADRKSDVLKPFSKMR